MATYHYSIKQSDSDYSIRRTDTDGSNAKTLLVVDDVTGNINVGDHDLSNSLVTLFDNAGTRKKVSFLAPTPLTASFTLDLPTTDGNANQVCTVNANNGLNWSTTNYTVFDYGLNSTINNQQKEIKTMHQSLGADGYRVSTAGTVTHITLNCECSVHTADNTFTVEIYKNGSDSGVALTSDTVTGTGFIRKHIGVALAVSQGDTLSCFLTAPSSLTIRKTAVLFVLNAA